MKTTNKRTTGQSDLIRTLPFVTPIIQGLVPLFQCVIFLMVVCFSSKAQTSEADLLTAVRKGDVAAVKSALAASPKLNVKETDGRTPLMVAVLTGNMDVINLLLDKGADVRAEDNRGISAGRLAATIMDFAIMEAIDRALGDTKKWDAMPASKREEYFKNNETSRMKERQEALLDAVKNKDADLVAALLRRKTEPNTFGEHGVRTPLMLAAENGNLAIVICLLDNGADPNIVTKQGDHDDRLGRSALFFATENGNVEVVRALLKKGANANLATRGGGTALVTATASPNGDSVIKLLLEAGAKVDAGKPSQKAKDDALLMAAYYGNAESVKLLLAAGADPNAHDERPKSAIQYAATKGHADVMEILKQAGAKDQPQVTASKGQVTASVDPAKVTKAEWRKAVAPFDITSPQYKLVSLSETAFKTRFGKPVKEQRLGDSVYWYFKCSDGELQVVIDADFLPQQGVMIKSINEY